MARGKRVCRGKHPLPQTEARLGRCVVGPGERREARHLGGPAKSVELRSEFSANPGNREVLALWRIARMQLLDVRRYETVCRVGGGGMRGLQE